MLFQCFEPRVCVPTMQCTAVFDCTYGRCIQMQSQVGLQRTQSVAAHQCDSTQSCFWDQLLHIDIKASGLRKFCGTCGSSGEEQATVRCGQPLGKLPGRHMSKGDVAA